MTRDTYGHAGPLSSVVMPHAPCWCGHGGVTVTLVPQYSSPHEHCWCVDCTGSRAVPSLATDHEACCMCGTRRLRQSVDERSLESIRKAAFTERTT